MGWIKNVLIHQIENQTYEKTLLNQTNFEQMLPESIREQAQLASQRYAPDDKRRLWSIFHTS